jgi:hypothetical protein
VAIETASVASEGVEIGDLSFVITPYAKSLLESLFAGIEAACGASLKKRQTPNACATTFIQQHAPPELSDQIMDELRRLLDGGQNLVEYLWDGVAEGTVGGEILAGFDLAAAFSLIAYSAWKVSKYMPDGIVIPKANIKTTTRTTSTSTSKSTSVPLIGLTFMTDFIHAYPTPVNSDEANAMATALQGRIVALEAAITPAAPNCECTQIVGSDGTKAGLNCPVAQEGQVLDCSVSQNYCQYQNTC